MEDITKTSKQYLPKASHSIKRKVLKTFTTVEKIRGLLQLKKVHTHRVQFQSTIYALSSGRGKCGVAVVRISGRNADQAILKMTSNKKLPKPRLAKLCPVFDPSSKEQLDRGIILWFPAPNSFTGENMCELQIHGGLAVVKAVLTGLSKIEDFRPAEPGEFTKRAFLKSKFDLTEVEGLADLIHAETDQQRKQALAQMEGSLTNLYSDWRSKILRCMAHVEAFIDFSETEEDIIELDKIRLSLENLSTELFKHLEDSRQGQRLRDGVRTAILGPPNVGKSSLLNYLVKRPAAIVAPIPGTTRDVVEQSIDIAGYPLILADTAGIRNHPADEIEQEGIYRAVTWGKTADLVLLMTTTQQIDLPDIPTDIPVIKIFNKIDKLEDKTMVIEKLKSQGFACISCKTKEGMEEFVNILTAYLKTLCGQPQMDNPTFSRDRHKQHLNLCLREIQACLDNLNEASIVISAHHLRKALTQLALIAGKISNDDVLDVIFKDFCIGK